VVWVIAFTVSFAYSNLEVLIPLLGLLALATICLGIWPLLGPLFRPRPRIHSKRRRGAAHGIRGAERRVGELFAGMPGLEEQGGDGRSNEVAQLETLGPERHQFLRWRAIASISEPDLDALNADTLNMPNHELTTAGALGSALDTIGLAAGAELVAGTQDVHVAPPEQDPPVVAHGAPMLGAEIHRPEEVVAGDVS